MGGAEGEERGVREGREMVVWALGWGQGMVRGKKEREGGGRKGREGRRVLKGGIGEGGRERGCKGHYLGRVRVEGKINGMNRLERDIMGDQTGEEGLMGGGPKRMVQ